MENNPMVSVVLLGEVSPPDQINHFLTQIVTEQTHKNLDILVVTTPRLDLEEIHNEWNEKEKECTVRFLEAGAGVDLISMGSDSAMGEIVFYKTCAGTVWYPRHIEVHVEEFRKNKKAKWGLSHIEKRDVDRPNDYLNLLGWRIDSPPEIPSIIVDEICHRVEIKPKWDSIMVEQDGQVKMVPGMVLRSWTEDEILGCTPDEITVVQWDKSPAADFITQPAKAADSAEEVTEKDKKGETIQYTKFPTIVGNSQLNTYNDAVRKAIGDYQPKRIAIKRTIGLGDVIQTEPIVKKLKEKYNNPHITFFTSKTRSCATVVKYFDGVDTIVELEESALLHDVIGSGPPKTEEIIETESGDLEIKETIAWKDDFELRFDLDLAYESRTDVTFIGGYCDVAGLSEEEVNKPNLTFTSKYPDSLTGSKYAILCNEGSGWAGKEWNKEGWKRMAKVVQKLGYTLVETAQNKEYHLFENSIKTDGSFDQFLQYCQHSSLYLGADNGTMHVCGTFDVPCFVVAGAALPSKTFPKADIHEVTAPDNDLVGLKHRFFYRSDGPAFVPAGQEKCFEGLTVEHVEEELNNFLKSRKL